MKSATCGHTRYLQFSLLIALILGASPLLKAGRPSIPKQQELQAKIDEQQNILRGLHEQIDQQATVAESARETAGGAGALGDLASVFIDEFVREQKVLDELKRELTPRITQAEQTLAVLQAQQTVFEEQQGAQSLPIQAAKRRAEPAHKKQVAASRSSLQRKQEAGHD